MKKKDFISEADCIEDLLIQELDQTLVDMRSLSSTPENRSVGLRTPVQAYRKKPMREVPNNERRQSLRHVSRSRKVLENERKQPMRHISRSRKKLRNPTNVAALDENNSSEEEPWWSNEHDHESSEDATFQDTTTHSKISSEKLPSMPSLVKREMERRPGHDDLSKALQQYYINLRRGNSTRSSGQDGNFLLLQDTLKEDVFRDLMGDSKTDWKPSKILGTGANGKVIVWEKVLPNGSV